MVVAAALVLAGLALAAVGVRVATSRPRPLDLAGALLAPAGLLIALLGAGRALSPQFFGSRPAARPAGPLRIMPAGDSLTQGSTGTGRSGGGYRAPLWRALQAARVSVDLVGAVRTGPPGTDRDHEAWNGITIEPLARRLERDLEEHRPDVVLVLVGTNDVAAGASPDVIEARLRALLAVIARQAPTTQVLLATLPGVRVPNARRVRPESIAAVNARIRKLAADRATAGDRLRLVDLHERSLQVPDGFTEDGVHPSDAGYAEIAAAWLEALRPALRAGR